ncbi:alpha/beta hydrolase [Pseudomonas taiwanensis]|uniref:Alpha/beta hydrolase n=1 Tax=Pseudomonas shirazica TaxID=1940636 RepID=A0ABY9SY59_9PSED|nr:MULTISPECIES: alpha/beta hydrolase [Pseudomonas]MDT8923439.1 alpha/beta hydrolase [Pseudomonas taiwanensis]WMY87440.1 alpha/beta hydrolase [Pseudomonas shirazica]
MMLEVAVDAEFHEVPCSGHWVPEENPASVANLLIDFDYTTASQ